MDERHTAAQGAQMERLSRLSDYEVSDDSADVRGWSVTSADGQSIGRVDDLIVDTGLMKAKYLLVDLDREIAGQGGDADRHVLVPVERAYVDDADNHVRVDVPRDRLTSMPRFSGAYASDYDDNFRRHAPAQAHETRGQHGRDEQRITRSAEELKIGKRAVQAGEVQVHKRVDTERVSEPVSRTREDVRVERRPVSAGHSGEARIGEDEIRVPITEEEVVVDKRPVVKEELVIAKDRVTETENVEADVRRERVDVERVGRPDDDERRNRR
jgi:uncharacterized protein (TIGR02271 family)